MILICSPLNLNEKYRTTVRVLNWIIYNNNFDTIFNKFSFFTPSLEKKKITQYIACTWHLYQKAWYLGHIIFCQIIIPNITYFDHVISVSRVIEFHTGVKYLGSHRAGYSLCVQFHTLCALVLNYGWICTCSGMQVTSIVSQLNFVRFLICAFARRLDWRSSSTDPLTLNGLWFQQILKFCTESNVEFSC